MSDVQRLALARDLARRQQLASHDELRVLDRILQRLELGRERYGLLDLRIPRDWHRERGEELLDAVIYDVMGDLAQEDRTHAELQELARSEMVAPAAVPVPLVRRTPEARREYFAAAVQIGTLTAEVADGMLAAAAESDVDDHWGDPDATKCGTASARIAKTVDADSDDGAYSEWDVSDAGGGNR